MSPSLKLIVCASCTLQNGRVNGAQSKIIHRARKVEQTETIYVTLVFGRDRYLVAY
jgi:hypothetical protein